MQWLQFCGARIIVVAVIIVIVIVSAQERPTYRLSQERDHQIDDREKAHLMAL